MDKLSGSEYKNKLTKWKESSQDENDSRHRSCNISATQEWVDRVDRIVEKEFTEQNTRSEFLREVINSRLREIEEQHDLEVPRP
jgi:predicted secreted protein